MAKIKPFRKWFYLRTGYQLYFSFIFAGVNTLVITYFLAIERAPFLKEVFPTFPHYAVFMILTGVPILIFAGFIHFKKMPAFKSEQEVAVGSNPFVYKLAPGHQKLVMYPFFLLMSEFMLKLLENEKITEEKKKEMQKIQEKMKTLLKGGYIGVSKNRKMPFKEGDID